MPDVLSVMPFQRVGEGLIQGQTFSVSTGMDTSSVAFHDFDSAQQLFSSQEVFRGKVLGFQEGLDLVSGQVGKDIFVLEASQARALLSNSLDRNSLIEGLKP